MHQHFFILEDLCELIFIENGKPIRKQQYHSKNMSTKGNIDLVYAHRYTMIKVLLAYDMRRFSWNNWKYGV